MQVQLFLINIAERTQKQLPLVKGNFVDIYRLQEELLKQVVRAVGGDLREVAMPKLNLTLPEYEKFIKSLLLSDADKKLELLLPAAGNEPAVPISSISNWRRSSWKSATRPLPGSSAAAGRLAFFQGQEGFPAGPGRSLCR